MAIRSAREKELSGICADEQRIGGPHLDRLVDETGASGVTVLTMTEAQACARVGRLVTGAARLAACEEGIKRRWFATLSARSPTDREVEP